MSLAETILPGSRIRTGAIPWRCSGWLAVFIALTTLGTAAVVAVVAAAVEEWSPATGLALALVTPGALWVSGGAATAILGCLRKPPPPPAVPDDWRPKQRTAILVLLCGEAADPLSSYLAGLRRQLAAQGLAEATTVFVLSDTHEAVRIADEEAALAPLIAAGTVVYRRRSERTGHKPGNIAEWLAARSDGFTYMLVLDADSRMSAGRIRALMHRIETEPGLGLLQAGIARVRGRSLFGRHQRLSGRLLSPHFGRGLAAWSGKAGNYWGHNAIMRIAAFRSAAALPILSGPRPFGGTPLSHDFVEAAWIRREGWVVALDPDTRGSAEDGPQTLADFHRRDRRWCQGNLQHLRLIGEPGLDPVSRLHLALGIIGYLAAPVWLALMILVASDAVAIQGVLPLLAIATILMLPKLCALGHWLLRARTRRRQRLILRAGLHELAVSTLVAPLVMLRQSGAVLSVLAGRDCGWKRERPRALALPPWLPEVASGTGLLALGAAAGSASSLPWLLPVALPLLGAPLLQRWLERGA
ncbi:glucans biosynthesis glucosyltransferase MdoH [Pseudohaliea rubra]|uniref:Glucans biosynthesis glucosyltransferase H n=1 Tax=Pseudohaliea rubra DSM 19751 TaxID=1265313 RepID=A0A095VNG9_9GAMM|nr:glucans biosynthesis glucosyltransferase MdoH [Pseudohaliea rubra]KGE02628.1 Glucans biosynthesis glucosyltransferase H [Pseudohaliea rubra DSM 19751]